MPTIDYYFSTISPYTYLAGPRLREIAEAHGAEVNVKPLDIVGLFPRTGGTPLGERHPARQAYRLVDLERNPAQHIVYASTRHHIGDAVAHTQVSRDRPVEDRLSTINALQVHFCQ